MTSVELREIHYAHGQHVETSQEMASKAETFSALVKIELVTRISTVKLKVNRRCILPLREHAHAAAFCAIVLLRHTSGETASVFL